MTPHDYGKAKIVTPADIYVGTLAAQRGLQYIPRRGGYVALATGESVPREIVSILIEQGYIAEDPGVAARYSLTAAGWQHAREAPINTLFLYCATCAETRSTHRLIRNGVTSMHCNKCGAELSALQRWRQERWL